MMLQAQGLHFSAGGKAIVRNAALHVGADEVVGLIGPNGCGKSTLMRMLYRVLPSQGGQVLLDGQDIGQMELRAFAQQVAVLAQNSAMAFDGPVLDTSFKSFVGMQPIPIVYGMTIGEYALMLTGENWLSAKANAINAYNITTEPTPDTPFHVQVIKCKNYDHKTRYILPVMPSPNLKEMQSIYLYPSTCFFEGTVMSEGRGTDKPFQVFGHPSLPNTLYAFTPKPNTGAKNSKCFYQRCYGWNLSGTNEEVLKNLHGQIQLKYLQDAYRLFPGKDTFFLKNNFFRQHKLLFPDNVLKQLAEL